MSEKKLSFAEGLSLFNARGLYSPRINLTVNRAARLRFLMKEVIYSIPDCDCGEKDCNCNDEYYAAIEWVHQQIQKRYSPAELALCQTRGKGNK